MATVNDESLHLLSIDLASAPVSMQTLLELRPRDVHRWLARAHAAGTPLAVVRSATSIDLYSTEAGRHAAFKPLLASLWALGHGKPEFGTVRASEVTGSEVARHLLRQAAGLDSTEGGQPYAARLDTAWAEASNAGTLSPALEHLFRLATTTRHRCLAETELEALTSTRASRQLEALGAERIVEEELVAFRVAATNDNPTRASLPPPRRPVSSSILPTYAAEPGSSTRIKVSGCPLEPTGGRRASLGLSQRRSG